MAKEEARYFTGSISDRRHNADGIAEYCKRFLSSGVWALEDNLIVSASTGMNVALNFGNALVEGYPYAVVDNDTGALILTVEDADLQPRVDRVVVRKDAIKQHVYSYIKKGTPDVSPSPPALDCTDTVQELSFAKIAVSAGVTEILAGDITDERSNDSVCGVVTCSLAGNSSALDAYPVGAIYISVDPTNPETLFGGTWVAFAEGRTLVGLKSSDSDFSTVEGTTGSKIHTLTDTEMPSHTHIQNSHTHSIEHNHGSFTSGVSDRSHTHGFSANTNTTGSHTHPVRWKDGCASGSRYYLRRRDSDDSYTGEDSDAAGAAGSHKHSVSGTTGGYSTGHYHSVNPPNFTGNSGSKTATNQNTGGGGAHNNIQPSIVVYMWKRTA